MYAVACGKGSLCGQRYLPCVCAGAAIRNIHVAVLPFRIVHVRTWCRDGLGGHLHTIGPDGKGGGYIVAGEDNGQPLVAQAVDSCQCVVSGIGAGKEGALHKVAASAIPCKVVHLVQGVPQGGGNLLPYAALEFLFCAHFLPPAVALGQEVGGLCGIGVEDAFGSIPPDKAVAPEEQVAVGSPV